MPFTPYSHKVLTGGYKNPSDANTDKINRLNNNITLNNLASAAGFYAATQKISTVTGAPVKPTDKTKNYEEESKKYEDFIKQKQSILDKSINDFLPENLRAEYKEVLKNGKEQDIALIKEKIKAYKADTVAKVEEYKKSGSFLDKALDFIDPTYNAKDAIIDTEEQDISENYPILIHALSEKEAQLSADRALDTFIKYPNFKAPKVWDTENPGIDEDILRSTFMEKESVTPGSPFFGEGYENSKMYLEVGKQYGQKDPEIDFALYQHAQNAISNSINSKIESLNAGLEKATTPQEKSQIQAELQRVKEYSDMMSKNYSEDALKVKNPVMYDKLKTQEHEQLRYEADAPIISVPGGITISDRDLLTAKSVAGSIYKNLVILNSEFSGTNTPQLSRAIANSSIMNPLPVFTNHIDKHGNPVVADRMYWEDKNGDAHFSVDGAIRVLTPEMVNMGVSLFATRGILNLAGRAFIPKLATTLGGEYAIMAKGAEVTKNYANLLKPMVAARYGKTAGNLALASANFAGVLMTTFPKMYQENINQFKTNSEAATVAFYQATIEALTESIFPDIKYLPGMKAASASKLTNDLMRREMLIRAFFPTMGSKTINFLKRIPGATASTVNASIQEGLEEVVAELSNYALEKGYLEGNFEGFVGKTNIDSESLVESFLSGALMTLPLGAASVKSNYDLQRTRAFYDAAINPDFYKQKINTLLNKGKITQEEAQKALMKLQTVSSILDEEKIGSIKDMATLLDDTEMQFQHFENRLKKDELDKIDTTQLNEEQIAKYNAELEAIAKFDQKIKTRINWFDDLSNEEKESILKKNVDKRIEQGKWASDKSLVESIGLMSEAAVRNKHNKPLVKAYQYHAERLSTILQERQTAREKAAEAGIVNPLLAINANIEEVNDNLAVTEEELVGQLIHAYFNVADEVKDDLDSSLPENVRLLAHAHSNYKLVEEQNKKTDLEIAEIDKTLTSTTIPAEYRALLEEQKGFLEETKMKRSEKAEQMWDEASNFVYSWITTRSNIVSGDVIFSAINKSYATIEEIIEGKNKLDSIYDIHDWRKLSEYSKSQQATTPSETTTATETTSERTTLQTGLLELFHNKINDQIDPEELFRPENDSLFEDFAKAFTSELPTNEEKFQALQEVEKELELPEGTLTKFIEKTKEEDTVENNNEEVVADQSKSESQPNIMNSTSITEVENDTKSIDLFDLDKHIGEEVEINGVTGLLIKVNEQMYEIETPTRIYEFPKYIIENVVVKTPTKQSVKYNTEFISETLIKVNGVNYIINLDSKGNTESLSPTNNKQQRIKNNGLLVAVDIERNKRSFENNDEVTEVLEVLTSNLPNIDSLLNNIWNYNLTDVVSDALDKLYDKKPLTDNEALQTALWLTDVFDRLSKLINSKNSKLENDIILKAYDTADLINSLLYDLNNITIKYDTKRKTNKSFREIKNDVSNKRSKRQIKNQVENQIIVETENQSSIDSEDINNQITPEPKEVEETIEVIEVPTTVPTFTINVLESRQTEGESTDPYVKWIYNEVIPALSRLEESADYQDKSVQGLITTCPKALNLSGLQTELFLESIYEAYSTNTLAEMEELVTSLFGEEFEISNIKWLANKDNFSNLKTVEAYVNSFNNYKRMVMFYDGQPMKVKDGKIDPNGKVVQFTVFDYIYLTKSQVEGKSKIPTKYRNNFEEVVKLGKEIKQGVTAGKEYIVNFEGMDHGYVALESATLPLTVDKDSIVIPSVALRSNGFNLFSGEAYYYDGPFVRAIMGRRVKDAKEFGEYLEEAIKRFNDNRDLSMFPEGMTEIQDIVTWLNSLFALSSKNSEFPFEFTFNKNQKISNKAFYSTTEYVSLAKVMVDMDRKFKVDKRSLESNDTYYGLVKDPSGKVSIRKFENYLNYLRESGNFVINERTVNQVPQFSNPMEITNKVETNSDIDDNAPVSLNEETKEVITMDKNFEAFLDKTFRDSVIQEAKALDTETINNNFLNSLGCK